MAIYGGAIVQSLLPSLLADNRCGIVRTPEWIANRVNNMASKFKNPLFIGLDGSRFDSTQH